MTSTKYLGITLIAILGILGRIMLFASVILGIMNATSQIKDQTRD